MLSRFLKRLDAVVMAISMVGLVVLFVVTLLQVFMRYVARVPFVWSYEFLSLVFLLISALAGAVVLGRKEHFTVPMIADALGPRGKLWFELFSIAGCAVFALIIAIDGFRIAWRLRSTTTPVLGISEAIPNLILPVMGIYMLLHTINHLHQTVYALAHKEGTPK